MARPFHVTALGSAIVDVIAPVEEQFLLDHSIAKGVMTLADEFRASALYEAFGGPFEIAGGSAANTMAGLASLGARGAFVGKVRDDRLGSAFADSLRGLGIQYTTAPARSGPTTACCLIAVTPDGQRSMNTYLGAARELCVDDIDQNEIAAADILYIEGYLWDAPSAREASLHAIAIAKAAGTKIAFTLSDPFCVGRYRSEFLELIRDDLDILFANEEEAKSLLEVAHFDDVVQAMRPWGGVAALTRSAKGCVIVRGEEMHVIDAVPVAQVVDTTGAGDQFAAGFLFGLTQGQTLANCGQLGALAAAEVISHYGARPEISLQSLVREAGLI